MLEDGVLAFSDLKLTLSLVGLVEQSRLAVSLGRFDQLPIYKKATAIPAAAKRPTIGPFVGAALMAGTTEVE